jgi:hypothetical protein
MGAPEQILKTWLILPLYKQLEEQELMATVMLF